MTAPRVSVVVPSHDRPLRLRWLLNALEEQTLPREEFEVLVVHDSQGAQTDLLLASHPLGVSAQRVAPSGPATKRNAGWRAARAPLVVFTDDDCRPAPDWLERLLAVADAQPGAIVQGPVVVDPDELVVLHHAPWARSQEVTPPSAYGQTANIAYPRDLLGRTGGFDEALPVAAGEDTDLLIRAKALGAPQMAAPDAVVLHAVFDLGLGDKMREAWRWTHLAEVVKRHPQLREHLVLRVFWKVDHPLMLLALAGVVLRRPWLMAPWALRRLGAYGPGPRARARAATEIAGNAAVDLAELSAAVRGSVRARTLFL
ncbi:glycosyltransferase family 2 protein [Conexibacter sp. SYSU D00693]|uniref:glycosyltransferase family 2 protein n=1 Tax=Conexibacter sp. SYSU D00693 TaxID=2812560 RepID=UPI00196A9B46|nr:glycosyltransferase [Conexibacter sp. SYSU D00693]